MNCEAETSKRLALVAVTNCPGTTINHVQVACPAMAANGGSPFYTLSSNGRTLVGLRKSTLNKPEIGFESYSALAW